MPGSESDSFPGTRCQRDGSGGREGVSGENQSLDLHSHRFVIHIHLSQNIGKRAPGQLQDPEQHMFCPDKVVTQTGGFTAGGFQGLMNNRGNRF